MSSPPYLTVCNFLQCWVMNPTLNMLSKHCYHWVTALELEEGGLELRLSLNLRSFCLSFLSASIQVYTTLSAFLKQLLTNSYRVFKVMFIFVWYCVHLNVNHVCAAVHVWTWEGSCVELVLFLHLLLSSESRTQVTRLAQQVPLPVEPSYWPVRVIFKSNWGLDLEMEVY